jgi:hypothetical protein
VKIWRMICELRAKNSGAWRSRPVLGAAEYEAELRSSWVGRVRRGIGNPTPGISQFYIWSPRADVMDRERPHLNAGFYLFSRSLAKRRDFAGKANRQLGSASNHPRQPRALADNAAKIRRPDRSGQDRQLEVRLGNGSPQSLSPSVGRIDTAPTSTRSHETG